MEAEEFEETCDVESIMHKKSKTSRAWLIQKVYEIDVMTCSKCSSEMRVIAIITVFFTQFFHEKMGHFLYFY